MYNNVLGPSGSNNEELTVNNKEVNDVSKTNENDGNKSPKKKGKVVLIVILVLLLMGVMGFGGWKLGAMYAKYENNKDVKEENKKNEEEKTNDSSPEEENKTDDEKKDDESNKDLEKEESDTDKEEVVELKKNENLTFIKEYKDEITLNGKNMEITTFYYLDFIKFDPSHGTVVGQMEEDYYEVRADIFVNNNKIINAEIVAFNTSKKDVDSFVNTAPKHETKELKDTSNSDKYLLFFLESADSANWNGLEKYCYLIGTDGSLLETISASSSNIGSRYFVNETQIKNRDYISIEDYNKKYDSSLKIDGDKKYILYWKEEEGLIEVHDDFIYYLEGKYNLCEDGGYEYKFYIDNGKPVRELIAELDENTIGIAGGC